MPMQIILRGIAINMDGKHGGKVLMKKNLYLRCLCFLKRQINSVQSNSSKEKESVLALGCDHNASFSLSEVKTVWDLCTQNLSKT